MFKKLLFIVIAVLALFISVAFIAAQLYKKDIHALVQKEANNSLNAQCSFQDVSIGFIRSFPKMNIEIENILIIGNDSFLLDTLANIKSLHVQVSPFAYLFDKEVKIEQLVFNNANLHLKVLASGAYNWDIIKADTTKKEKIDTAKLKLELKKYELMNSTIIYTDALRGLTTTLFNVNHEGKGDFTQDVFSLTTNTEVEKLSLNYLGKTYLSEVKGKLKAPLSINFTKMEFAFRNNDLLLNELPIHFDAWIAMPDTSIDMDIKFNALKSPLKDFLSLVPILYKNSFEDLKADGKFALNGYMKGRMDGASMPSFGLGLSVENGAFKYSKIPAGIKQLSLQLNIDNKDGVVDHTIINLSQFQMKLNNKQVLAQFLLSDPKSSPYVKALIKGNIDLGELLKIIPQKNIKLSGNIAANIEMDGRVNALKQGKGNAKGNFTITNFAYTNNELKNTITLSNAAALITPKYLVLNNASGHYGNSDFNASGKLENYLMYFLKNETITGDLNVQSNLIDLNELMKLSDTSASTSKDDFTLPKNIRFNFNANISKILYKDLVLSNAKGGIIFADQTVSFNPLQFNLLEAAFKANGNFVKKDEQAATTKIDFNINNLSVNKAYKNFSIVQKYLPIAAEAQGIMNIQFTYESALTNAFSPNLKTVNAKGQMDIVNVDLKGSETINKMADLLKFTQFNTLEIKPVNLSFTIVDGRFAIKPFNVNTNFTNFLVAGSNGLDQTINYTVDMSLPQKTVAAVNVGELNKELAKVIPNINLGNITNVVKPQIYITGNVLNPQIKLGVKTSLGTDAAVSNPVGEQVKDVVNVEIKKQVNTKLDEAKKRADAIMQEAQLFADRIRKEAYEKADKMVADTKNPFAQIAVSKIAEKLKSEADKKAAKILADANTKAQAIIDSARQ